MLANGLCKAAGAMAAAGILLAATAIADDAATAISGRWLAEGILGGGVNDRLQSVLEIRKDGTVAGSGGCNRLRAKAKVAGRRITFSPIASTRMACAAAVMQQEAKFLSALRQARLWRIDAARDKLELLGANGKPIVVLTRM